jgi:hypothetical protein
LDKFKVFEGQYYEDLSPELKKFVKKQHIKIPRKREIENNNVIIKKKDMTRKRKQSD